MALAGFSFSLLDGNTLYFCFQEQEGVQEVGHYTVEKPACATNVIGSTDDGLVLSSCEFADANYCIWTPNIREITRISGPANSNALIMKKGVETLVFFLSRTGVGEFVLDSYSLLTDAWRKSHFNIVEDAQIISNSHVDFDEGICWKIRSMGRGGYKTRILFYGIKDESFRVLRKPNFEGEWEIGSAAGKLCCVLVRRDDIIFYSVKDNGWNQECTVKFTHRDHNSKNLIRCENAPRPMPFKSSKNEFLVLVDNCFLIIEADSSSHIARLKKIPNDGPLPEHLEECIPHTVHLTPDWGLG